MCPSAPPSAFLHDSADGSLIKKSLHIKGTLEDEAKQTTIVELTFRWHAPRQEAG